MGCPAPSAPPMPNEIPMALPVFNNATDKGGLIPLAMPADSILTLKEQEFYDTLQKKLNS